MNVFIESHELPLKHRIPVKKTEKYWKGLENGVIYKTVCRKCNKAYYPPRSECICGGEVEWLEIDGEGVVEAFTVVYAVPKGFEWKKAYTIAIANFGDVRVMGWAKGEIRVGDKVRAYSNKDENGVWKVYFEVV